MGKYQLRQKVIRRINRFEITSDDIECLIYLGNLRFDQDPELDLGPREPYATIEMVISDFSDRKRYDLMCLMYLGRNIAYTGFNEEAVEDFCFYTDEWKKYAKLGGKLPYGIAEPEYLAGKKHIAKWLRLVKEEVQPDCWEFE